MWYNGMMRRGLILAVAACVVGLCASDAAAWGPATHVSLALRVLEHLSLLPAALAALLAKHAGSYIYGSVAADIIFAKRLSRVKQFCHHWSTGFKLLDAAHDDRSRVLAYGYLSHLAADTIAHGKFVPRQLAASQMNTNFGHFFWELRADGRAPEPAWRRLEVVLAEDHEADHAFMSGHLRGALLSYATNRVLFDQINGLAMRGSVRRTVDVWSRLSRWPLDANLLTAYYEESIERVLSVLQYERRSAVLREDPNGTSALIQARVRLTELRSLKRRGMPIHYRVREAIESLAPAPGTGPISLPAAASRGPLELAGSGVAKV